MPSFTQIGQNLKEEFKKVAFPVFAILRKTVKAEVGVANSKVIQLHSGNLGMQFFDFSKFFECATYGVGVIGKNALA